MRAHGRFDVVVAQDYSGPAVRYAKGPRSSPLVTHLHNTSGQILAMTTEEHRGGRLTPVLRPMQASRERGQLADSDVIAACSRAVLSATIERYALQGKDSTVLHSFIDVEHVRQLGRAPFTGTMTAVDNPLVVFSGRLYGLKGVQELTLAMHRLWSEGSPARLVLAGTDGGWHGRPMVSRLRELAGPYADRLHHIGGLRHEQLFPLLRRAAVVALPSHWEGLPLALVEAVALGCPVVTTTGHGADDVLTDGENGLLVPPHDSEGLADAIARLLADRPLAERLGTAAAARSGYFDVTPGLARFESFYADVTASTSSAAV
jgi:glycosyltransferase involved in cell wall biosynthesis